MREFPLLCKRGYREQCSYQDMYNEYACIKGDTRVEYFVKYIDGSKLFLFNVI